MRGQSEWGASARGAGSRLSFTVGAGLAVAGGAGAFALCHSIDPGRGPLDAGGKIAATILALDGLTGSSSSIACASRTRLAAGSLDRPAVLRPGDSPGSPRAVRDRAGSGHRRGGCGPRGSLQCRWPGGHGRPRALEEARARAAALAEATQSRPGPRGSSPPTLPGGAAAAPPTRPPARARSWAICSPTCPCSRSSTRAAPGPIPTARCICAVS